MLSDLGIVGILLFFATPSNFLLHGIDDKCSPALKRPPRSGWPDNPSHFALDAHPSFSIEKHYNSVLSPTLYTCHSTYLDCSRFAVFQRPLHLHCRSSTPLMHKFCYPILCPAPPHRRGSLPCRSDGAAASLGQTRSETQRRAFTGHARLSPLLALTDVLAMGSLP